MPREVNSADESSDGEHGVETSGKPVDRLKKKTKMQLNKKVVVKAKEEMTQKMRDEKKLHR